MGSDTNKEEEHDQEEKEEEKEEDVDWIDGRIL